MSRYNSDLVDSSLAMPASMMDKLSFLLIEVLSWRQLFTIRDALARDGTTDDRNFPLLCRERVDRLNKTATGEISDEKLKITMEQSSIE